MTRPARAVALVVLAAWLGAAQAGPDPDLVTGINAYNAGRYAEAAGLLGAAAGRGSAEAKVDLAYLYVRGQGVHHSRAEALRLYHAAADAGDGEAMNAIGYGYEHGNSLVTPDIAQAVDWYCRAVQAGNPRAMNNLALLFTRGLGVPQDEAEARSLWRQSADAGHTNGMLNLGLSLLRAHDATGLAWLRRAAAIGNGAAQSVLGRLGETGAWPRPFDDGLRMALEPANPVAGHSRYCRPLVG